MVEEIKDKAIEEEVIETEDTEEITKEEIIEEVVEQEEDAIDILNQAIIKLQEKFEAMDKTISIIRAAVPANEEEVEEENKSFEDYFK